MQLSYRGISYETTTPSIEVTETAQTGVFLGNVFPIKRLNVAQRQSSSIQLQYRGASYRHLG